MRGGDKKRSEQSRVNLQDLDASGTGYVDAFGTGYATWISCNKLTVAVSWRLRLLTRWQEAPGRQRGAASHGWCPPLPGDKT